VSKRDGEISAREDLRERMSTLEMSAANLSAAEPNGSALAVVHIGPSSGWVRLNLAELWEYRELLAFLVWRDLKVRYKQTVLGAAWAVLQPVAAMMAFSVFFGGLAKVPSDGVPYPLFAYCALLPWQMFANSLTESGNSLVSQHTLIKKVYFPRLLLPVAPVLAATVDFGIGFVLLLAMMAFYGMVPGVAVVVLPLLLVFTIATAIAVGLWLSALNVQYRDVRYTLPFLVQFWMFATPVAYPSSLVPEKWRPLMGLNPMAGVVEGFRWALLGTRGADLKLFALSAIVVAVLLVSGVIHFRRVERTFADMV
jgi:lipopolysaccharide transport system permease protein